jgi:alkylation response protein AidB-like acyl-CoA dehydrogenase
MGIGGDEAHDELLGVLRTFVAKQPLTAPVEFDRTRWRQLADLGVFALPLSQERGGLDLGLTTAVTTFEVLGEALTPGPLVWTQLAAFLLPDASTGAAVVTGLDMTGVTSGDPVVLPHLRCCDRVLVLDDHGVLLYERDAVEATEMSAPLDPNTPVARVHGWGAGRRIGDATQSGQLRRSGTLLTAALLVGVSAGALRVATEYAAERRQFGRPIGSFQAVKHLLADAYTRTNLARAAVYAAAEFEQAGRGGDGADLATAKLLAGRAADANARTAVQVFGGMGFAAETPPHLFLKRAWLLEHEFGTMHDHAAAVADVLGTSA